MQLEMLDDANDTKMKTEMTMGSVRSDTSLEVQGELQLHEADIKTRRHPNSVPYSTADLLLSISPQ